MGVLALCVSVFVLGFHLQARVLNSQGPTCDSSDLMALEGFVGGLEGTIDGWAVNSSNCCDWAGITCSSSASLGLSSGNGSSPLRVVKLELPRKQLFGVLSESLSNLDQLRILNLSQNSLRGPFPDSLFHFPNLEVLDLSENQFSGPILANIDLPDIQIFDVSNNFFVGSVPASICTNSSKIRVLTLEVNSFNGSIPPDIGNCNSLRQLSLATNYLTGTLPEDLFRLSRLVQLTLQDNFLSGDLSSGICDLSGLVYLDLSSNRFSGNIPDCWGSLRELNYLSAHSNKFSGGIPPSISNSQTISTLILKNNSLGGLIMLNCSAMGNLGVLDLGSNNFYGPLPDNLPFCPKLKAVNFARNRISGPIPESFKYFHSLVYFSVSNCSISNISAALEILQHCRNLSTVVMTMNFLNEELPSTPVLKFEALKYLIIANCRLTGSFPEWFNGLTSLQLVDLSWNRLSGRIPASIGNFQSLFYLDLSNNSLTGEIPLSLAKLPALSSPVGPMNDPSLDFPFFMRRDANGRQYNQIFHLPSTVDLSNNFLSGPILPEFGNLKGLHILNLKFNNLSGSIPSALSGMTRLETLDLSHNQLSGGIPESLVGLSFLSQFSVAYNNLTGAVPLGGQFPTFPNSSFEGNPGLCGKYYVPCQTGRWPSLGPSSEDDRGFKLGGNVYAGFATGAFLAFLFWFVLPTIRGGGGGRDRRSVVGFGICL